MATTSVSKSANATSWEKTQAAGGAAWARLFIDSYRSNPEDYALDGWVEDAERLFKDNRVERNAFYDALEKGFLPGGGTRKSGGIERTNALPNSTNTDLLDVMDSVGMASHALRVARDLVTDGIGRNGCDVDELTVISCVLDRADVQLLAVADKIREAA